MNENTERFGAVVYVESAFLEISNPSSHHERHRRREQPLAW